MTARKPGPLRLRWKKSAFGSGWIADYGPEVEPGRPRYVVEAFPEAGTFNGTHQSWKVKISEYTAPPAGRRNGAWLQRNVVHPFTRGNLGAKRAGFVALRDVLGLDALNGTLAEEWLGT